jgi:alpha-1,2-mannosyltransferase
MPRSLAFAWVGAGIALFTVSVLLYRGIFVANPSMWTHSDEWVYRAGGLLARQHPADLYRQLVGAPGAEKLAFAYPPFAALVFAAASPLSFGVWQTGLVAADLILLLVISYASVRLCGLRGLRAAGLAMVVAAAAVWLEPVYMTMFFGQINLVVLALILADLSLPKSSPLKGIGIGVAAGLKLTPLIFIPYLLATRRVRAGVTGLVSFAATVGIGFAALPAASGYYWDGTFAEHGGAVRLQNQSLNGIVQRLLHDAPATHGLWIAIAALAAVAGLATAAWASRRGLELLGIVLCGVTGLLISPISWTHHWVWVVPALALMIAGAGRASPAPASPAPASPPDAAPGARRRAWIGRAAGTAAILALFVMWPRSQPIGPAIKWLPAGFLRLAPHGNNLEYTWHGAMLLLGNSYVIAGLAAIAGTAAYLWATDLGRGAPAG